jgi:hypothetical protein
MLAGGIEKAKALSLLAEFIEVLDYVADKVYPRVQRELDRANAGIDRGQLERHSARAGGIRAELSCLQRWLASPVPQAPGAFPTSNQGQYVDIKEIVSQLETGNEL